MLLSDRIIEKSDCEKLFLAADNDLVKHTVVYQTQHGLSDKWVIEFDDSYSRESEIITRAYDKGGTEIATGHIERVGDKTTIHLRSPMCGYSLIIFTFDLPIKDFLRKYDPEFYKKYRVLL